MKSKVMYIFLFINTVTQAQIVSVPALEKESKVQTSLLKTIKASSISAQKFREKVQEQYTSTVGWVWDMQAFGDLLIMMETVICTSQDTQSNLAVILGLGLPTTCFEEFTYEHTVTQLKLAVDMTDMIIDKRTKLTNGDRSQLISNAFDKYVAAQIQLYDLNTHLKNTINREIYKEKVSSGYLRLSRLKRRY